MLYYLFAVENYLWKILSVCFLYQVFYTIFMLLRNRKKDEHKEASKNYKYGIIVSARNESRVIGYLLDSINAQNYDKDKIKIYVVADNCTDDTAQVARDRGAIVYERFNTQLVGKGYALDYLFKKIMHTDDSDAYIVFDADNIVDRNFIYEMNKVYDEGYKVITSYRNSKNYDSTWVSAGYSLWFIRESRYLNHARYKLHTSCAISGTGFLIDKSLILENNGWKYHLLTEDIELTVDYVCNGNKVGFSNKSVLYDEQPLKFSQSWTQRMRWSKGFYQIIPRYLKRLFKGILKGNFACFDMFMTVCPTIFATLYSLFCLAIKIVNVAVLGDAEILLSAGKMLVPMIFGSYFLLYAMGIITIITEWKNIKCNHKNVIKYSFTFPVFMLSYIPISVVALFKKVHWAPIEHSVVKKSVSEITEE